MYEVVVVVIVVVVVVFVVVSIYSCSLCVSRGCDVESFSCFPLHADS